jgi:iron complex outermembrane recepter protein
MKLILAFSFVFVFGVASKAQEEDTIKTTVLSEMVISGVKTDDDTLQSFYRSNPSATTEAILSRMTGVSLVRRGSFGQEPMIRGLSGGQINVTIGGVKIFGACTDKMDPVTIYIEPVNLSSIEMNSGVDGAEFGSTFGGALNMQMAEPMIRKEKLSGRAGVDFQSSARAINYFSAVNLSGKTSAYRASLSWRKSNNYYSGDGEEVQFSQYEKLNVSLSGKWSLGTGDTLVADALYDQGWNIGFPALPMDVGSATAGIYSLNYKRSAPLGIIHHFNLKAYHNDIRHEMSDAHRENVIMRMNMPGRSVTSGVWTDGELHVFHEHKTFLKFEFFRNALIGEMSMYPSGGPAMYMQTAPKSARNNAAAFVRQEYRIDDRNTLELLGRGEYVSDRLITAIGIDQWEVISGKRVEHTATVLGTFGLNYRTKLSTRSKLALNVGYGQRVATLNEKFGYYLFNRFDGYDYLGSPELSPESSVNLEGLYNYYGDWFEVQVSPFTKSVRNYISSHLVDGVSAMTPGARGVKQNINLPSAQLSGVDVMILAQPLRNVQLISNVKYTYGRGAENEPLPMVSPLKTITTVRLDEGRFNMQLEWEWSSAQSRVADSFGERETASYSILAVRGGYRVKDLQFSYGVENVFDKAYREHLDWGGIYRPGRNFYINIGYKF